MNNQRFIIEMGMGNDQYGQDYTKAAGRAIEDAFRHSAIPMFQALEPALGLTPQEMRVQVTIGVQDPAQVDTAALVSTCRAAGRRCVQFLAGKMSPIRILAMSSSLPAQRLRRSCPIKATVHRGRSKRPSKSGWQFPEGSHPDHGYKARRSAQAPRCAAQAHLTPLDQRPRNMKPKRPAGLATKSTDPTIRHAALRHGV